MKIKYIYRIVGSDKILATWGRRKFFSKMYFAYKVTNKDVVVKFKITIGCQDSIRPDAVTLKVH